MNQELRRVGFKSAFENNNFSDRVCFRHKELSGVYFSYLNWYTWHSDYNMLKRTKRVPELDAQKIDCRQEIYTVSLQLYFI